MHVRILTIIWRDIGAYSVITVGTFHAAPGPKGGGGGAPNCQSRRRRSDHFVGGGATGLGLYVHDD